MGRNIAKLLSEVIRKVVLKPKSGVVGRMPLNMRKALAGLLGALLLLFLTRGFFRTFATLPQFRRGGISDYIGFLGIAGIVYAGVAAGVLVRWFNAKKKGHVLTSKQAFVAGLAGVVGFSVAGDAAMGFYGLLTGGSFAQGIFAGQGMLFGMSVAAAISGVIAAAGVTLILFCFSK